MSGKEIIGSGSTRLTININKKLQKSKPDPHNPHHELLIPQYRENKDNTRSNQAS